MTIKKMREFTGLSQVKFAEMFNIPRRTIESWESGERVPPPYVVELIAYRLRTEGYLI